ncbi:ABC transporter ATP-binding protein [Alkalibacterium iburiense]|uniref:ABC transporter ATP-binding protein n=1 Tax=Alkalibacterium iburiense TaxID=290589 RepID=A0ABP3HJW2_9LACT
MTAPIIEAKSIKKAFKKTEVLKGIDFRIYEGEVIALVGENGAGKSTLIKIINNLTRADDGHIQLFGQAPDAKEVRNRVGVMLQENIVLHRMKVKEMLELAGSYYAEPLTSTEIIDMMNLDDLADKKVTELSGGQKRKVNFALSLVGNPDVVFLDEPTASMDVKARKDLWEIVSYLKEQGKTIVVTSHYLEELENIASRILILQEGVIAFDGTLHELRKIRGEGTISFNTELSESLFNQLEGLVSLHHQSDYYSLITQNVNALLKQLIPYIDELKNITIQQTTLNHLLAYYKGENQS